MPARKTDQTSKPVVRKPAKRTAARGTAAMTLPDSMITGKASPAKAADGDTPVFAYILESMEDVDERQITAWMKQIAAVPGVGGKKR